MKTLNTRQNNILSSIVRSYIDKASPVGSQHLVENYRLKCSPATIRNEMVRLEDMGYIQQPHTSAGRVPTDEGYKLYISELMQPEPLTPRDHEQIRGKIFEAGGNMNLILEEASRILGKVSDELGVVLTPWISWGIFDRLEFLKIADQKVLVVIHVCSRLVKTVILEVESDLEQDDLEKTADVLNERLSGLTLEEIQSSIDDRVRNTSRGNRMLMHRVVELASNLFDFSEPLDVHTCGTYNILSQPEFSNINMRESLLSLIDNKRRLIKLFHRKVDDVEIRVGLDNEDKGLHSFTVITARYSRGKDVGTLGVIGPTRMRYRRILPLMNFMTQTMCQHLG